MSSSCNVDAGRPRADIEPRYVADSEPSLTAAITIASYGVEVIGKESSAEEVRAALKRLVDSGTFSGEHKGKTKVFDLARSPPGRGACQQIGRTGASLSSPSAWDPKGPSALKCSYREALSKPHRSMRLSRT